MFVAEHPIASLRPADYNPRRISDEALNALCDSLREIGIVKPVVALQDGLIVAGHQRTRAAKIAGFEHTPVCFLSKKPNPQDEIRFNQLHNGTDNDSGEENAWVDPAVEPGFAMATLLKGNYRAMGASTRSEVARMLTAYGNWGGCVAAMSGEVLSSASYALAAAVIGQKVRTYYVADDMVARVREIFAKQYGRYDYSGIDRKTFNQTFAQMFRLRGEDKKNNRSPTYEWLMQTQNKALRILDFGCGQGDYVAALKKNGYDIHGVEFFRRKSNNAIDVSAVHAMIDKLVLSVRAMGLWDIVICDYVMNSVDTQQAEDDVLACVNAFLKPGGRVFFSGRPLARIEKVARSTTHGGRHRDIEFLDENGITGLYRGGDWFFQKFHSQDQIKEMVCKHFRDDAIYDRRGTAASWQVSCIKEKQAPGIVDAIAREFNLPLPGGRTLNRHAEVLEAMSSYI